MMMMKISLPMLLWCGLIVVNCYSELNDTEALEFVRVDDGDNKNPYLRYIHLEPEYMLVGARNRFYNVSLLTMAVNQRFEWAPLESQRTFCQNELEKFKDCDSYIRTAIKLNDSHFFICASSAKKPMCRHLRLDEGGAWSLSVQSVDTSDILPVPMAPIFPWMETRKLVTHDAKMIYIASHNFEASSVWRPFFYMKRFGDLDEDDSPELRSEYTQSVFKVDYDHERPAEYKGIFETKDYVFLTFTEPAVETFNGIGTEIKSYSRMARVCKNDRSRGYSDEKSSSMFLFSTLFKTRMLCGSPELQTIASQKFFREEYAGYYATYLNDLADSSTPHLSSIKGADGEEIILAIFNSERNAIKMSAICAYKVSDLNRVFDNSPQIAFGVGKGNATVKRTSRFAARCSNDSRNMTKETRDNLNNYLLYDPVKPLDNKTLFMSTVDYRMTHLVVDWQVEAVDGKKYDVVFVSTDDGRLITLVKYANTSETEETYHPIDERVIFPGKSIREMKLIRDDEGKKHLILNTLDHIKRIALEKCHFHSSCSKCIGLQDPYCSWSPSISKCVSTTHEVTDKYQNISSGESEVCYVPTKPVQIVENTKTTPEVRPLHSNNPGMVGATKQEESAEISAVYIALIVILPVVSGAVAFLFGYLYSKKKFMNPTTHLEHELTKNSKGDTMKSNCDAYQTLPKQSNLQLMNNLNGKVLNNETASMGERTLTRQKQVYV